MRPVTTAPISSVAVSPPIVTDYRNNFQGDTVSVLVSAGAVLTAKVQYTTDYPFAPGWDPATANWFDLEGATSVSSNATFGIATPVTAVRLNVTARTSGSATLRFISGAGG